MVSNQAIGRGAGEAEDLVRAEESDGHATCTEALIEHGERLREAMQRMSEHLDRTRAPVPSSHPVRAELLRVRERLDRVLARWASMPVIRERTAAPHRRAEA